MCCIDANKRCLLLTVFPLSLTYFFIYSQVKFGGKNILDYRERVLSIQKHVSHSTLNAEQKLLDSQAPLKILDCIWSNANKLIQVAFLSLVLTVVCKCWKHFTCTKNISEFRKQFSLFWYRSLSFWFNVGFFRIRVPVRVCFFNILEYVWIYFSNILV